MRARVGGLRPPMVVLGALVAVSIGIMTAVLAWGWRVGTVRETAQERADAEFWRIVRRVRT
jgi:hypothetical protein